MLHSNVHFDFVKLLINTFSDHSCYFSNHVQCVMGDTDFLKPIFDPGHLLKGGGQCFLILYILT